MCPKIPASVRQSRRLALWVLCAATLVIILDGTIVTVALPSIQRDLSFSASNLSWVMNAYMITFGSLLLLAGRLGDLVGRRRMFISGLAVFTAASLLCGLSTASGMLIVARFAQGAGAAMVSAVSLGMIVTLYPEPRQRARAIGAFSFVGAVGASIGLLLGGVLTELASWHWIFFVNLPAGAAAGVLALYVLEDDRGTGLRSGADWLGALLVTAGLVCAVYAIVGTARYGWSSAHTLGTAGLAVALLVTFVIRQAIARPPLLPLSLFRARSVSVANLAQLLVIAAAFGFQVVVTLYFQQVLRYGPAAAGLALFPAAAVIGTVSLGFSARLASRFGQRTVLLAGLVLIVAGFGVLARIPVHGGYLVHVLPALLVFGLGGGLTLPALASLAMSAATEGDAGLTSGLFNTTQQVGAALGVAVLSTLAAARTASLRSGGLDRASALTGGYRLAVAIAACLTMAATIMAAGALWSAGPHGRRWGRVRARRADAHEDRATTRPVTGP